ncbi:MAG: hypothetical protein E6H10_10845 [Bacteroidetes bacterium]|nr:MAG: hypothetical protein E6H10_10845 [Bacteroidota bacterium]
MEDLSTVAVVTNHQSKTRHFELIRFDKKVNIYVGVCLLLYFLFVVCKWHNSSIALWNWNINDGGDERRGLVAGRPLPIRSDEWLVESSFILAQEKNNFPLSNEALGYGNTPLMMGLPVKHFLSIIKPALWGYYILDSERAFSWQWNFKIFPFLISSFLFLMLFEKNNFPLSNEALGYGNTPLMMGLPVKHFLSIIKPALWGYYILDSERAFSWQWNFKIFPFLISSFLFLMLFTKNNFLISVFGSAWLFLSSAIQWWSINTEIFTYTFFIIISLIYVMYSVSKRLILVNGLIFIISAYSFATILYPAYQVPISYFILFLVIVYVVNQKNFKVLWREKFLKIAVLVGSLIVLIILGYLFYVKCSDTIKLMSNTVYPGKRNETGGGLNFISMFNDNFSWFVHETYFPPKWGNICELSSFLMLSPIVVVLVVYIT